MKKEVIYLGADHAGFKLKEFVKSYLEKKGHEIYDLGAHELNRKDDYPDFAIKVAQEVSESDNDHAKGILCCGSAQGMCITANKVSGIRAVSATSVREVKLTRTHNNANVLCLAGWYLSGKKAVDIVDAFLSTEFSGLDRHVRRLKKIARAEK